MKSRFLLLILSLFVATLIFAGGKGIDGADVTITKRPGGQAVTKARTGAAEIKRHGNQIEISQQIEMTGKAPGQLRGMVARNSSPVGPPAVAAPQPVN